MLEHNAHKLKRHAVHPRCSSTNHLLFAPIMLWHFDVLRSFPTLLEFLPILHCPVFSWWENHLGSGSGRYWTRGRPRSCSWYRYRNRGWHHTPTNKADRWARVIHCSITFYIRSRLLQKKKKKQCKITTFAPMFHTPSKKTNPDYEILNCQIFFWENYYWTWSVLIQLYKMQISGTHDSIDSTILSNTDWGSDERANYWGRCTLPTN